MNTILILVAVFLGLILATIKYFSYTKKKATRLWYKKMGGTLHLDLRDVEWLKKHPHSTLPVSEQWRRRKADIKRYFEWKYQSLFNRIKNRLRKKPVSAVRTRPPTNNPNFQPNYKSVAGLCDPSGISCDLSKVKLCEDEDEEFDPSTPAFSRTGRKVIDGDEDREITKKEYQDFTLYSSLNPNNQA